MHGTGGHALRTVHHAIDGEHSRYMHSRLNFARDWRSRLEGSLLASSHAPEGVLGFPGPPNGASYLRSLPRCEWLLSYAAHQRSSTYG